MSISDTEYLRIIQSYYPERKAFPYYYFEKELKLLSEGFNTNTNNDPLILELIKLFNCMLNLFSDNIPVAKTFFDEVTRHNLPNPDSLFGKMYDLLESFFKIEPLDFKPTCKVIISRDFDDLSAHILVENLNLPRRPGRNIVVESSQDNLALDKLFSENEILFINGHGDDELGGLKYYIDFKNFIRIPGPLIRLYVKDNDIKVMGLLSCSSKAYENHLDIAEYMIFCKTSTTTYTEMYIKAFYLIYSKTNDLEFSLKMALISLFFVSNEEFSFSIFHNGKPVEL